jgi:hypothetical protein
MEAKQAAETLCWNCSKAYQITLPKCPRCDATNANHDLEKACSEKEATKERL